MEDLGADRQPDAPVSPSGRGGAVPRVAAWALIVLAAVLVPAGARAGTPAVEALGGWEGDSRGQGYGFVGAGVLFPAGEKFVVPLRASGSYLYYNFNDSGTTTRVSSPGASVLAGIRYSGTRGTLALLAGGEVRREQRTLEGAGGTSEVSTVSGVVVQADGDLAFGRRWRGYLFGNYGGASSYLYGRTAMRCQVTNLDWKGPRSFFLGLEAVGQGNNESDAMEGGGFAEWNFVAQKVSLIVRGGYKDSGSPGEQRFRGGYFGIGLYHRF